MKRKFFKELTLFVSILMIFLAGMSLFLHIGTRLSQSRPTVKTNLIVDHALDVPVSIWGTSVAEGAIDPLILGNELKVPVYNMGYSGRKIPDWSGILNEYLDYSEQSEVIIMDVFPNILNKVEELYYPNFFYSYMYVDNIYNSLVNIKPDYWKFRFIPFYNLTNVNSLYIDHCKEGWKSWWVNKKAVDSSGFCAVSGSFDNAQRDRFTDVTISDTSVLLYKKLIQKVKEKNIKLVFVATPIYWEGIDKYTKPERVYGIFEEFAKSEHVYFLDYSRWEPLVKEKHLFKNNTHLNKEGARKFTLQLSKELNKILNETHPLN